MGYRKGKEGNHMATKANEYVLVEVFVDKFGNVERREFWRKVEGQQAAPISARAYRARVDNGAPWRVHTYNPQQEDAEDNEPFEHGKEIPWDRIPLPDNRVPGPEFNPGDMAVIRTEEGGNIAVKVVTWVSSQGVYICDQGHACYPRHPHELHKKE